MYLIEKYNMLFRNLMDVRGISTVIIHTHFPCIMSDTLSLAPGKKVCGYCGVLFSNVLFSILFHEAKFVEGFLV